MPTAFTMPKLSPTMEEGTIAKWHKKEGDFVKAGEVLLEVATDKATVEHAALDEGYLRKILVPDGKSATINQPIAIFSESKDENIEEFMATLTPKEKKEAKKQPTAAPKEEKREESVAVRTEPLFVPEAPLENYDISSLSKEPQSRIKASPLAKKIAKQKGLDLTSVTGSGPGNRITSEDLANAQPASVISFGPEELPKDPPGSYEEIPLTPIRKIIAKRLQESKSFIPHYYVKQQVVADRLWDLYQQLKALNLKITLNDLLIRACALTLRSHPEINSGFNSQNQTIIRFKTIDIAVAVTFEEGLVTPIIRYADYKNVGAISTEIRTLAERARAGKLKEHEYKGGSFTISNLGMFGINEFMAIINPPQAAILAVGGVLDTPLVSGGKVEVGKTLQLTLSCDHRVIDGAQAAKFLADLKELLENPVALTV